ATVLLIAPSIHHRLLFRRGDKEYVVQLGNRFAIAAAAFLALGLVGILVLISNFVFGGALAPVVGACAAVAVGVIWFGLPIRRRRHD
ncbi:MAG TPA: DUF6328 family protein, partial [Thermoanaerobaculia bacterium]|nr:DUF6328 family protein [Thermoanaerobaculia bacterium]